METNEDSDGTVEELEIDEARQQRTIHLELDTKGADTWAALGRSGVGWMPFVGPLLSEVISAAIPNQRLDRVAKLLEMLVPQLGDLQERIDWLEKESEARNLLEAAILHTSKSPWDEKVEFFANLLLSGLTPERIEQSETLHLMKILDQINDVQILILRSYVGRTHEQQEFKEQHPDVFKSRPVWVGGGAQNIEEAAIFDSYKQDLERLGLLRLAPTQYSGKAPVYELSNLGKTLLRRMGITDS